MILSGVWRTVFVNILYLLLLFQDYGCVVWEWTTDEDISRPQVKKVEGPVQISNFFNLV